MVMMTTMMMMHGDSSGGLIDDLIMMMKAMAVMLITFIDLLYDGLILGPRRGNHPGVQLALRTVEVHGEIGWFVDLVVIHRPLMLHSPCSGVITNTLTS